MNKVIMLTAGSYSDYTILSILRIPDGRDAQADIGEYKRRLLPDLVASSLPKKPPRGDPNRRFVLRERDRIEKEDKEENQVRLRRSLEAMAEYVGVAIREHNWSGCGFTYDMNMLLIWLGRLGYEEYEFDENDIYDFDIMDLSGEDRRKNAKILARISTD